MKPDGIGDGGSPLADFLRGRVERILAAFQAGPAQAGSSPDRAAVERFLLALDELAAATDALSSPRGAERDERTAGPILVAGEEPFAAEVRRGVGPDREVLTVAGEDAAVRALLEQRPELVVGSGARGADAIRRIHALRPGLPALLAAPEAEAPALVESFKDDPVVVLRAPGGKELELAIRALLQAGARSVQVTAETPAKGLPQIEARSYAHLAGLLPRALERTVAFDVGAAVIARPGAEPLVDVFSKADCPGATLELVRARALALFHLVSGGSRAAIAAPHPADSTLRSSMYFPLATEGAVVGLTYLAAFQPDAFSVSDEQVLAALARHASGAYRRLEASVHHLRLSPRQSQVLALIASGLSDKEVASRLGLAHRTVRTHVDRMLREHGLRSRTEAVAAWLRGRQG